MSYSNYEDTSTELALDHGGIVEEQRETRWMIKWRREGDGEERRLP
jgi:hypothetical protein